MILLLCLGAGVVLGLAAGGRIAALSALRLRGESVLVLLLIAQAALPALSASGLGRQAAYVVWVMTFPVLIALCLVNFRVRGALLMAAGLVLNAAVILLNSGMPVSPEAVAAAGGAGVVLAKGDFAHVVQGVGTRAAWLADVLPIAGPRGVRGVASVGDLVMGCGVAAMIAAAMLGHAVGTPPRLYAKE